MRLTVRGVASVYTGYGQLVMHTISQMQLRGVDVKLAATGIDDYLGHKVPAALEKILVPNNPNAKKLFVECAACLNDIKIAPGSVLFTMWEVDSVPRQYVEQINASFKHIIVPCKHNAEAFKKSGVKGKIHIVELGLDPRIFALSMPPARRAGDVVTFATIGRMHKLPSRKRINDIIKAFIDAFPTEPNVRLKLKVFPECDTVNVFDRRIEFIKQVWRTEEQCAAFIHNTDVGVFISTGEGWGLPQQQFMACGRPVIIANYSGPTEFFTSAGCYELRYKLRQTKIEGHYLRHGKACIVDHASLVQQFRRAYYEPTERWIKGIEAWKSAQRFTWHRYGAKLFPLLKDLGVIYG